MKLKSLLLLCLLFPFQSGANTFRLVSENQTVGQSVRLSLTSCDTEPLLQDGEFFELRLTGHTIQFVGFYLFQGITICSPMDIQTFYYDLGGFAAGDYQLEIYMLSPFNGVTPINVDFNNLPPVTEALSFGVLPAPASVPSINHFGVMLLLLLTLLTANLFMRRNS